MFAEGFDFKAVLPKDYVPKENAGNKIVQVGFEKFMD